MTNIEQLTRLIQRKHTMLEQDKLACKHWVVYFRDKNTQLTHAYDAADPEKCFRSITGIRPQEEFIELRSTTSPESVIEIVEAFRFVNEHLAWINERVKLYNAITEAAANRAPTAH